MQNDKECRDLINNIVKELEKTRNTSINIGNKLGVQTENIQNIKENLEDISHETDVSKWQLNYIESTFGKIYRKFHNYPVKSNISNLSKLLNFKTKIMNSNFFKSEKNVDIEKHIKEDDLLDKIENMINDIKQINNINSNEISKQNVILDYNNQISDISSNKINRNTKKINKLLD